MGVDRKKFGGAQAPIVLEGGGEVGAAYEVAVEFKRYEIATPSLCSGLRLIWSLAMTT